MKRISLTANESENLESALVDYGNVVTFDQLSNFFDEDRQYTRIRINKLVNQGWLMRVKKGVFVISDFSSRGSLSISHKAVVNLLVEEAYISFETALQHHGLYDQLMDSISSVSLKQYKSTTIDRITFNFTKTQQRYFYGWEIDDIDGQSVKIAHSEKALVDLIQFHRSRYSTDLVLEKLREFNSDISHRRFIEYALKANITTRRILGFLMEIVNIDNDEILTSVNNRSSVSFLSHAEDSQYNHKWRLYYGRYFEQYLNE